jgi:hypothetical protein
MLLQTMLPVCSTVTIPGVAVCPGRLSLLRKPVFTHTLLFNRRVNIEGPTGTLSALPCKN